MKKGWVKKMFFFNGDKWMFLAFLLCLGLMPIYVYIDEILVQPYAPAWLLYPIFSTKSGNRIATIYILAAFLFIVTYSGFTHFTGERKPLLKVFEGDGFNMKRFALVEIFYIVIGGLIIAAATFL